MDRGQVDALIKAIRSVSYGDMEPAGLEGVAMALAGSDLGPNVSESLIAVAEAINNVAAALRDSRTGGEEK